MNAVLKIRRLIKVDEIYLDHAGTTLYSKSLMDRFSHDMMSNLYGNPHSGSGSSQASTARIEDIRLRALHFFKADPEEFDLVFVANATAGIKLVMDSFRSIEGGFIYGYHQDAHTSLVGVRENAVASQCLADDEVEEWLRNTNVTPDLPLTTTGLFAYPAQSNMDGRRLPLSWAGLARAAQPNDFNMYTLLDAAALASTSPLDLRDTTKAPDFTVLSFSKVFGFPDMGALLVKRDSGQVLRCKKYFGGGTVDMVVCLKEQWHAPKEQTLHEVLEDGTLAIHNILALGAAMSVHADLFDSMERIAKHTMFLAERLYKSLKALRHSNGEDVCWMYNREGSFDLGNDMQGPTIAFNLRNAYGAWISNAEVEKLAAVKHFHIRTGGLCNPGGIATALDLSPWEMKANFSAGFRCGNDNDIMSSGKPTGVIRISLGAMSTISDVDRFIKFIREFYIENFPVPALNAVDVQESSSSEQIVESLTIYPIKSCGGFSVPAGIDWEVRPEGLAWDREWCLVHQGTGQALSQKRYPRMALIRPTIDLFSGTMTVKYVGNKLLGCRDEIQVPLSADPSFYLSRTDSKVCTSRVCGDAITARTYLSTAISEFFTNLLSVPCALARFPAGGSGPSARHAKAHMQQHQRIMRQPDYSNAMDSEGNGPPTPPDSDNEAQSRPILLSNESPILMINKASMVELNHLISLTGGKLASPSVFRANIVIANKGSPMDQPYCEDHWSGLRIGQQEFKMLGACRRCHMICVDQDTAIKDEEPFVTLAKTRRFDGKVFFGSHMCHVPPRIPSKEKQFPTVRVGSDVSAIWGN